ncbi:MAG: hypothetical protein KF729_06165 [Sandaracinaceae bacterium]|nr:hypothetical protein [Sandaracinaceae bacterium]
MVSPFAEVDYKRLMRAIVVMTCVVVGCGSTEPMARVHSTPAGHERPIPPPPAEPIPDDWWPPLLPRYPGASELAARSFDGSLPEVRFQVEDARTTWEQWVASIEAAGGVLENLHDFRIGRSATIVIGGERYFASVQLGRRTRSHIRRAAPDRPHVERPCTPIPAAAFSVRYRHERPHMTFVMTHFLETRWSQDVDADGAPDALVPIPRDESPRSGCPADVRWDLYLSRGDCGHHLGRFEGEVWRVDGRLGPVIALREADHPTGERTEIRYDFDGSSYRERSRELHEADCAALPAGCGERGTVTCEVERRDGR